MVVVVLPTPPFWFAIAMTRGVGYGPVGVVPGVFMMSQEYRHRVAIGGMALNVPRGTFSVGVNGRSLMFHVEHCHRANANRLGDAHSGKVYSLPAVGGSNRWF